MLADANVIFWHPPKESLTRWELDVNQALFWAKRKAYDISAEFSLQSSLGIKPQQEQILRLFLAKRALNWRLVMMERETQGQPSPTLREFEIRIAYRRVINSISKTIKERVASVQSCMENSQLSETLDLASKKIFEIYQGPTDNQTKWENWKNEGPILKNTLAFLQ